MTACCVGARGQIAFDGAHALPVNGVRHGEAVFEALERQTVLLQIGVGSPQVDGFADAHAVPVDEADQGMIPKVMPVGAGGPQQLLDLGRGQEILGPIGVDDVPGKVTLYITAFGGGGAGHQLSLQIKKRLSASLYKWDIVKSGKGVWRKQVDANRVNSTYDSARTAQERVSGGRSLGTIQLSCSRISVVDGARSLRSLGSCPRGCLQLLQTSLVRGEKPVGDLAGRHE